MVVVPPGVMASLAKPSKPQHEESVGLAEIVKFPSTLSRASKPAIVSNLSLPVIVRSVVMPVSASKPEMAVSATLLKIWTIAVVVIFENVKE